jgi:polar amino acid transport system permease protein
MVLIPKYPCIVRLGEASSVFVAIGKQMTYSKKINANAMRWLTLTSGLVYLTGCSGNWGWYVISPATDQGIINIKFLLGGLKFTILLSVTAIVVAIVLGLLIALPGISKNRAARRFNWTYVELIRAIPLLVMILWVYYGLPQVAGISIGVFSAGVLALAISDSAFQAEIFRAGIQSIDRGQIEAADALGLTYFQRMRFIVLPQAIRRVLPPLGNQLIYMLKMSSLISVIGMQELTRRANELVVTEYRPLEIYTFLVLEYLVLILIASSGVRWLERHLALDEN